MSIIEDKLKALKPGEAVKLIHSNGTSTYGTIKENDGIDSLFIEIKSEAVFRYSSIAGVEFASHTATNAPIKSIAVPEVKHNEINTVPEQQQIKITPDFSYDKMKEDLPKFASDLNKFESSFKKLDRNTRMCVQGQLSKIRSGHNAHDLSKIEIGVNELWNIIKEKRLDYDPEINMFIGYAYVLAKMYKDAAESFYFGNDIYSAFSCAITAAISSGSVELYNYAGTYAAIYTVKNPKGDYLSEALNVLEIASNELNDLSAISFVIDKSNEDFILSNIIEALRHIAKAKNVILSNDSNIDSMLKELGAVCRENGFIETIEEFYFEVKEESAPIATVSETEEKNSTEITDISKKYMGRIVSYNFFEKTGKIEIENGNQYPFETKNIPDEKFRKKVEKLSKKDFEPIPVCFYLSKSINSFYAIKISEYSETYIPKNGISYANEMFSYREYKKALAEYEKMLKSAEWEDAFLGMLNCYLALDKQSPSYKNIAEMRKLVDKYRNKVSSTVKSLSILNQYYMKVEDYKGAIKVFDELISISGDSEADLKRVAFSVFGKAKCYNKIGRTADAIEQLEYWLKVVSENKLNSFYSQRETSVFPTLSDLYLQTNDYENAEKYALLCQLNEKKSLLERIEKLKKEQNDKIEDDFTAEFSEEEDDDDDISEAENYDFGSLDKLENEYVDTGKFESLNVTDKDIIEKAFTFDKDKLYCMTAYLSAAAYAARNSEYADNLKTAELCVRAASGSLLSDDDYNSTNISYHFGIFHDIMPDKYETMFAASALRTLFEQTETPDYESSILTKSLQEMELTKKIPSVLSLAELLLDFRNQTGYGISEFADYKTDKAAYERIQKNAEKCRESLDKKLDVFESKGRLRRTREILFIDPNGILRSSLDAACANDTNKLKDVKAKISEGFIRSGKSFEYDNIDKSKIDELIDTSWDKAKEVMLSEKRHVNRPHEKLIDPKRRNVIETVKKVLKCIFEWIESAEKTDNSNYHAKSAYAAVREDVISCLEDIKRVSTNELSSEFDWGYYFLGSTADELLSKVSGNYDEKARKYMYIDFLRTDNILLDDNYQPEIYATFNDMSNFNILKRIEKHMETPLPTFAERIDDLFSNDISKNNLRSASLIRAYGEDMGISEITDHNMYNYLEKCIVIGRSRLKDIHEDFINQLELYQSYGALSDINGEKTAMVKEADIFFRICFTNCDIGFYANLINAYNENISVSSEAIAERLNKQLDELEINPKYNWGIFNKDEIKGFISDRNFTVAENMMNCIRRNDTQALTDYSIEPFGYLTSFIQKHPTDYKAVSDASITLKDSICKYSGKNDIELALLRLTNNARKDVRGGTNLIKNWITRTPAGTDRITKLMENLGFNNITVTSETGSADDSYILRKEKQTGRVNYHYPLPAFSSVLEQEGARVVCLYGKFDADRLMDKYKEINTTSKHTIVLLDYALKGSDRRHLARKLKEEKSFSKTFILIDRVILFYLASHYQSNTIDKMLMSVTLPFSYYQPFSAVSKLGSMPPELYTGHATELKSIEDPDGCNLVYGGRQLGKSALLSMAAKHIDGNANGDRAIVIDIENRDYKAAALTVSANLVDAHILPEGSECDDWEMLARLIGRRLADDDPKTRINYLLLMLDEADAFIDSCKEVKYTPISVFKNLPQGRFKLVMAGLHNLSNFNRKVLCNNSVLPRLESIIVRPFQRAEGTELLTHALAYMGFRFEPDVIQLILAKTNYFPGLIQLYCQKLLESMKNNYAGYNEVNTPPYEVTESHIKQVLSDKSFTEEINKRLWMTLTVNEEEGSYYMVLALILAYLYFEQPDIKGHSLADIKEVVNEYDIKTIQNLDDDQLNEVLMEMWDLNIITVDNTPDGDRFMFSTESFRDLLGSKDNVMTELEKYSEVDGK